MADWPIIAARPFRLDPRLVKQITASPCYLEFGAMPDSDTRTVEEPDVRTNRGDSDEVAHIVMKDDQMRGYMSGTPIQALCGKVWVPTRGDLPRHALGAAPQLCQS